MSKPLNISLLTVEDFIRKYNCQQVTSIFIKESSSNELHKGGLFSEDIFGQIGSPQRMKTFGYIDLCTTVFHPVVYSNLISLKALYGNIMARKEYARFDAELQDFVRCEEDDEGADTGYKFFMDNYKKIVFVKNESISQNDKVNQIVSSGQAAFMRKYLVIPAGMRDIDPSSSRLEPDSINKLYISLMNYASAMPASGSASAIYDGIRFSIQKKCAEIYQYLFDMAEGKFGYFQSKYGSRNLALGTRNVISPAALNSESPDSPTQLKVNELGFPLFEAAKAAMPLFIYYSKETFFNHIFNSSNDQVALIDPKTYDLVYKPIAEDEKNKFISSDGVEKLVNLFKDREFRFKPLACKTEEDKFYYLFLVYDEGDRITVTRSLAALRNRLRDVHAIYDKRKLRPMTYAEFMYITCYFATKGKHCTVTRYPAQEIGSTVPCKVHLLSTLPGRTISLFIGDSDASITLPEYPIVGNGFHDSLALHDGMCPGMGADFDGDTVSASILLSDEANAEVAKYLNSPAKWFNASGQPSLGFLYLSAMPIYNFTRDPD